MDKAQTTGLKAKTSTNKAQTNEVNWVLIFKVGAGDMGVAA